MSVETHVDGNVKSCRTVATELRNLGQGIDIGGNTLRRAAGDSEEEWKGRAGDAFRRFMNPVTHSCTRVAAETDGAGQALDTFSDDLDTVKSRMAQARQVASGAGLTVNGETIEEPRHPGPGPQPGPNGEPPASGEVAAHNRAVSAFNHQEKAYREVSQTAAEARQIERAAHETLNRRMNAWQESLDEIRHSSAWNIAGDVTGGLRTAIQQADKWGETASKRGAQLARFRRITGELDNPAAAEKAAKAARIFEPGASWAEGVEGSNAKLSLGLRGTWVGKQLRRGMNDILKLDGKLGKLADKIPFIGAALATGNTAVDVIADPDKSAGEITKHVVADGGGFLASVGVTSGALAAAEAAGIAGGPVTAGAVALGIGAAYGVDEAVKHWPQIKHFGEQVGEDIAHGAESVWDDTTDFFGQIF